MRPLPLAAAAAVTAAALVAVAALAADLAGRKYPGYACKVRKVTANAVEVELK